MVIEEIAAIVRSGRFLELVGGLDLTRLQLDHPALDHVGIAVRSLETSVSLCPGLEMTSIETVSAEQVRVCMIPLGSSGIELLEGIGEHSVISRFIARRGEALHHVALRVSHLETLFARLTAQGVRLAAGQVRVGAGGHRYFFVHPAETGGVLVELVEDKREVAV